MGSFSYQKAASFLLIVAITLASSRLWSFRGLPGNVYALMETASALALLVIVVYNFRAFPIKQAQFSIQVSLFFFIPFVSAISAYIFHHQSFLHSVLALKYNFFWLLYFVLHIFKIPVNKLNKLMIFIGGVWVLLTILQQFTYPTYLFSTRDGETSYDFYRAGVYRFMIDDHHFNLFILFYFFYLFLIQKKIWHILPVLFSLIGFYYFGTRQFALAAIVCLVIVAIAQKGKTRVYSIIFIGITALVLVSLKEILFGGYIEMTNEQLGSNDEDIRLLSGKFFLFEYWPHWITTIIGNGQEHLESMYGLEMYFINKELQFYKADIGIIGAFNNFGILYVINIIWLNIKGLKRKYYIPETQFLRLFFFNALLLLIISEYYAYQSAIPYFSFILYMVDKSYAEKLALRREAEKSRKEPLALV